MTEPTFPLPGSGWSLARLSMLFYGALLLAALLSPRALDSWFSSLPPGPVPDLAYQVLSPLERLNEELGLSAAQDWLAAAFRALAA